MRKTALQKATALLLLTGLALGCRPAELSGRTDEATKRTLALGELTGFVHENGSHAWLGIPFAKPPVGDLRWRAPQPPEPWKDTLEATEFGPSCVQFASPAGGRDGADSGEPTGSEDCLYLNVFAPAFAPEEVPKAGARLPVMMWIHGGGNTIGDAVLYDGSELARRHGVVLITVHYRLGVLGWFSHEAVRGDGTTADDRSGNYGTLDFIRALEWIERNVAAFGGDPRNVTVFGESAGGSNTASLLVSPRAAGLFHRAIIQSGGFRTVSRAEAEHWHDAKDPGHEFSANEVLARWLVGAGRAADVAAARQLMAGLSAGEIAAFARSLAPEDLLAPFDASGLGGMYQTPRLIRDGRVLPLADPLDVLRAGLHNPMPVMLGTNLHENRLFNLFVSEHVSRIGGLPVRIKDLRAYELESDYPSLMWKALGVDEPAQLLAASQAPGVFGYRFDWDDSASLPWVDFGELLGAAHGLEIPFVFGRLSFFGLGWPIFDSDNEAADRALSDAMMSYWTQFAATGDPGRGRAGDLPAWSPWGAGGGAQYAVLDTDRDGGIRMLDDAVDRQEVVRRLAADDRFTSDDERCSIYRGMVVWGSGITREAYAGLLGGHCQRNFPIEAN